MDQNEVTNRLLNRIIEGATLTKAEMIEAIHENNKEYLAKIDEKIDAKIDGYRKEVDDKIGIYRQEVSHYRQELVELRKDMKTDFKWLAGSIISINTFVIFVANYLSHMGH